MDNSNVKEEYNRSEKKKVKKRKRSMKSENVALKKPMYAYSVFLSEKREDMSKNNLNLSFNEVTNLLGTQWSEMTQKEKRPYTLKAEEDKRKYMEKVKEMQHESEKNSNGENDDEVEEISRRATKSPKSSSTAAFNIPIFTEEFLDYNKTRESDLRQLRKTCAEFREQNVILSHHVDDLKSAINKLDEETKTQRETNEKSEITLKKLRENLVRSFINVQLPETGMRPTLDNIDKYMKNVYMFLENDPNKYPAFSHEVRAVMRMLDIAEV